MGTPVARDDHLAFISELLANLREAQNRPGVSAEERGRYQRWLEHVASLRELLATPKAKLEGDHMDGDLPPVLLKELRRRKPDQREGQILTVLTACGGSADLDEVLIGLYRSFGVIEKRRVLQNKLWRLVRKGRISKAKNSRNVFCLDAARRGKRKR